MRKNSSFRVVTAALALSGMLQAVAQPDSTIIDRTRWSSDERETLLTLAWQNPAVKQWQRDYSISDIALSWNMRHEQEPLTAQLGNHETILAFDAQTYVKHGASTLWGRAYYNNGRQRGIRWNETSDRMVVYPYLLADSVDTQAMKLERYSFMGGYARDNGRFAWGATIGYTAGLYWRNVDPRPRNVTADLDMTAGLGVHVGAYAIATSLAFKKYKQTNNVVFYSEMGNDKLFHLTGLTNDYGRFAGTGYNTYYKGQRWSFTLNLHPNKGRGLSAAFQGSRMAFDNVLTSINKLPMAHVTHNAIDAELAWMGDDWGVRCAANASRRVGTENVFGDPAAQVYQQIGCLDNYHENRFAASLEGVWQHRWQHYELSLHPAVAYHHLNEIYADPQGRLQVNDLSLALRLSNRIDLRRTLINLAMGVQWVRPFDQSLMLTSVKDELAGLQRAIVSGYEFLSGNRLLWSAALSVTVPINADYALRASTEWTHGRYVGNNLTNCLATAVAFLF